jgi:hypothetical protein
MTLIHKLTLGSHLQASSFEKFARERYFPSISLQSTRVGQLSGARLLRSNNEYLLISEWSGLGNDPPRITDNAVAKLFDAYRTEITLIGEFSEVARTPDIEVS